METPVCSVEGATCSGSNLDQTNEVGPCSSINTLSSSEKNSIRSTTKYLERASRKCETRKLGHYSRNRNTKEMFTPFMEKATGRQPNMHETNKVAACIGLESASSNGKNCVTSRDLRRTSQKCNLRKLAYNSNGRKTRKTPTFSLEEATGSGSLEDEANEVPVRASSSLEYASKNEQNSITSKYRGRLSCRLKRPTGRVKDSSTSEKSKETLACSVEETESCTSSSDKPNEVGAYSGPESSEKSIDKHLKRVSLKCQGDTNQYGCWIWGLVVISDNKLIVTDYNNMAVKMVDIQNDQVLDCMIITTNPRGITIIDQDQIAVTVPDELKIKLIKINKRSLLLKEDITTTEKCYGIVFHSNTFLVSCTAPRRIQTLNMEGLALRSFKTFSQNQPLIVQPAFISLSLDKQSLYMTDSQNCCITKFSLDGKQLTEYAHYDLRGASGIAVDKNGYVYVATWSGSEPEKGRVYKFNEDLSEPKIFLGKEDGVLYPCPIYLNRETNMLYLSNSYLVNDYVSIYHIGNSFQNNS